jgi:hypothetical protein
MRFHVCFPDPKELGHKSRVCNNWSEQAMSNSITAEQLLKISIQLAFALETHGLGHKQNQATGLEARQ